jgi:alpha-mannosidase
VSDPIRLWYTFGNHMHWVDMQWLWGYHVLPGSTFDMLRFCEETGAKGNVNFDGIGYEKMAAEAPEALAALKSAIAEGKIEPVGCSYGQPYGLFHGGESNIRQRVYGARTVMRLLGVRPRTFWEEEFDFFPQLPQMLKGCGFENASLYFQWTWHTPEVPFESSPVVWWEGIDGSRLLTATRNRLNLHQWPEDFQILLDELAESGPREVLRKKAAPERGVDPSPEALSRWEGEGGHVEEHPEGLEALVLQWLELMPSPDWMCRSELMIPKLKELLGDERFEVVFGTLGEYLDHARGADVPVRRYGMHEVWHGLSLGKNGDGFRYKSRTRENACIFAESFAATMSLFGRPYAQWDVYPTWEIEEAWRLLLMAQHHDNDECEALCGRVGSHQYEMSWEHATDVQALSSLLLGASLKGGAHPGFHYEVHGVATTATGWGRWRTPFLFSDEGPTFTVKGGGHTYRLTKERPVLIAVDEKLLQPPLELPLAQGDWTLERGEKGEVVYASDERSVEIHARACGLTVQISCAETCPTPGFAGAACWRLPTTRFEDIKADTPYAVDYVRPEGSWSRKYPTGDWMTSPQWFEQVENPFVAQTFIDIPWGDRRLLVIQDRTRQWFKDDDSLRCVLNLRDPWDEEGFDPHVFCEFAIQVHHGLSNAELWEKGQASFGPDDVVFANRGEVNDFPGSFCAVKSLARGVLPTAFYREEEGFAGRGLDRYAGAGMGHPFVLRLVEFDGEPVEAVLRVAGSVARAYKTNLMGEIEAQLDVELGEDLTGWAALMGVEFEGEVQPNLYGKYSIIRLPMRGREIVTLYLDIVEGRKQPRDLDAHRDVWATVHRTSDNP